MSTFLLVFIIIGIGGAVAFLLAGIFNWTHFFDSGIPHGFKIIFGKTGGRIASSIFGGLLLLGLLFVLISLA